MEKSTYKTKRREREREREREKERRRAKLKLRLVKWSVNNNTESNWFRTESFGGIL